MASPRIPPLPASAWSDEVRKLLAPTPHEGDHPFNIFTTLARHPVLMRRWLPFGTQMLAGELPARDRELLILRTGWNCRSEYEWGQHVRIGRAVGLTDEEIRSVATGPTAPGWTPLEAALLRAADELHAESRIGDATWAALRERYDEKQLIEVPMLVGQYHLVAFTLNSLGVPLDPGVEGFPR